MTLLWLRHLAGTESFLDFVPAFSFRSSQPLPNRSTAQCPPRDDEPTAFLWPIWLIGSFARSLLPFALLAYGLVCSGPFAQRRITGSMKIKPYQPSFSLFALGFSPFLSFLNNPDDSRRSAGSFPVSRSPRPPVHLAHRLISPLPFALLANGLVCSGPFAQRRITGSMKIKPYQPSFSLSSFRFCLFSRSLTTQTIPSAQPARSLSPGPLVSLSAWLIGSLARCLPPTAYCLLLSAFCLPLLVSCLCPDIEKNPQLPSDRQARLRIFSGPAYPTCPGRSGTAVLGGVSPKLKCPLSPK